MTNQIPDSINKIHQDIERYANEFDRDPKSIKLVAASKTQSAENVILALESGVKYFGENYLQEALDKQLQLSKLGANKAQWHFIGAIQSRKAAVIAQHFEMVHTLDRLKIAEKLNAARADTQSPLKVLIQVNAEQESSKAGVAPEQTLSLAQQVLLLPKLSLQGLMIIPKPSNDFTQQRAVFASIRKLKAELETNLGVVLPELSMGMTNDMRAAIAEGATFVRIGTAIFGARC